MASGNNIYKVICDYENIVLNADGIAVCFKVVKDEILVDCEIVDDQWCRGKIITSNVYGKIPKSYLVPFHLNHNDLITKKSVVPKGMQYNVPDELNINENPLCYDEVENVLPREHKLSKTHATSTYVDMSSDENIDKVKESVALLKHSVSQRIEKPKWPPPQLSTGKASNKKGPKAGSNFSVPEDDCFSPNRSVISKTIRIEKQDEAGYEVPLVILESKTNVYGEKNVNCKCSDKKLSLTKEEDDARERYYDPPIDILESYFLSENSFFTIRILISFILALSLFLLFFLVLLMLCQLHALLAFSVSFVIFIGVLILPVSLLKRNLICVITLLIPSLFSTKAKIALVMFLILMVLIGPVMGIVSKFNVSIYCAEFDTNDMSPVVTLPPTTTVPQQTNNILTTISPIEKDCKESFGKVRRYCSSVYNRFKKICTQRQQSLISQHEIALCEKSEDNFCFNNHTLIKLFCEGNSAFSNGFTVANSNIQKINLLKQRKLMLLSKIDKRLVIISRPFYYLVYLSPLLLLFILWESYEYNCAYLTTKNYDNVYITRHIKELDCERKRRGLVDVVAPLTRIEFKSYLLRKSYSMSHSEKNGVLRWLLAWLICCFVVVIVTLTEECIHMALSKTQNDSCMEIYLGVVEFNHRHVIYFLICLLFICILVQSYILRLRSVVCDYFYEELIIKRSKYLYYKILHDRNVFSKHVRRKIKLLSEKKRLMNRISYQMKFKNMLPDVFQNVINATSFTRCMVCDCLTREIVQCDGKYCEAHYCFECYIDSGEACLMCSKITSSASSMQI